MLVLIMRPVAADQQDCAGMYFDQGRRLTVELLSTSSSAVVAETSAARMAQNEELDGRPQARGYDFHHPAVLQNVPPPSVIFHRPLRWWSLDRRKRLASVMYVRDQLINDIMHARDTKTEREPEPTR